MTADTITAIKKALEGVTPGEWFHGHEWVFCLPRSGGKTDALEHIFRNEERQENAAYVVATQPKAISELISTLESLQRENDDLRKKADNRESELVTMLNSADESRVAQIGRAEAAEADLREHQSSYILVHGIFTTEIQRLKNNLAALCEAYAACNGEDHPAYIAARTALSSTGGTHGN